MRNSSEQVLKTMEGNLYHITVHSVIPTVDNYVEVKIEFLDGPLAGEYHDIEIKTD